MSKCIKSSRRLGVLGGVVALAAIAAVVGGDGLRAQSGGGDVYRIEEDWQLVVGDADSNSNAPQVTCTISPASMDTMYCAFDLNYHSQPDYEAGGLQLHTWDPLDPIEYGNSVKTAVMTSSNETVTWTMRMTWKNESVEFRVLNGQSQTWGTFGHNGTHLDLNLPTSLPNLNSYTPEVSLNNSGVSYGGNLVVSQTLMAVRYYDVNGRLINEITTPQLVHSQQ